MRDLKINPSFWLLFFVHLSFFISPFPILAQCNYPYVNREFKLVLENFSAQDSLAYFSDEIQLYKNLESVDSILYPRKQIKNYLVRKVRRESFARVTQKDFFLRLDPIFNFALGTDLRDTLNEKLMVNSRGVLVRGNIGSQFAFESSFLENQAVFPAYLDAFADTFKVIPGQGRWKKFKSNGYDYAASQGTISYTPFHFLSVKAGHGKIFIGNGYRSLLLSDNAFNFPFAQLKFHSKRWSYSVIYASLQVVDKVRKYSTNLNEPLFKKKSASFQYLSIYPSSWLTVSLFQGTIFQVRDSVHPYFNWNVLNPIIYSSAFQYGLNNSPNVLLGADFKVNFTKFISMYGQYVLDDFSGKPNSLRNKSGFQLGAKYFNVATVKNLIVQLEYNQVRPYTYAHSRPQESYSHYGQSLAHPLGANFNEVLGLLNYHWKDIFIELKMNYAQYGEDSIGKSFGKNIFASDNFAAKGIRSEDMMLLQGVKTKLLTQEFRLSYLLNPASNLNVFLQVTNRNQSSVFAVKQNILVYFGIKTSLHNDYYDF